MRPFLGDVPEELVAVEDPAVSGLRPAVELVRAVRADPTAPLAVAVVGAGGSGKSALVASLLRACRNTGVPARRIRPGDEVPLPDEDPAFLLVDDAHTFDEGTLNALADVAEEPSARLVVTARPWPRPRALSSLMLALRRTRVPIAVGPLTVEDVGERASALLGSRCPTGLVATLAHLSGGHVAVVDQLVAEVPGSGPHALSTAEHATAVPVGVLDVVRHEVGGLDAGTRRLLLALAVDAPRATAQLAEVLGTDRTTLDDLLDRARASGLLLAASEKGDDHMPVLVARALERLGPADDRVELVRRVATSALTSGEPVLAPARRLLALGLRDAELAEVFTAAGDEALATAPVLAGALYAGAVLSGAASEVVVLRRAEAAALAGDLDTALRLADPLTHAGEDGVRARAVTVVAAVMSHRGMGRTAAEMLAGTRLLTASAVPQLVAHGRADHALEAVQAVSASPGSTTLRSVVALTAEGALTSIQPDEGAAPAALSALARAASLLEPFGSTALLTDSPAALAALVALHAGDLDLADSVLRRALEASLGGPALAPRHHLLRSWISMLRGDLAGVREHGGAARTGGAVFEPRDEIVAAAVEVGVARRSGDAATLRAQWPRAREALLRHPVDLFVLMPLGEILVGAARLKEEAAVRPAHEAAEALLTSLGDPPLWRPVTSWYGLAAACTAEDVTRAEHHFRTLDGLAGRFPLATTLAAAARAWLGALTGDVDPVAVETAARGLHHQGWTWDAARLAGEAAIRTRDRRAVGTLLACARALADTGHPGPDGTSAHPPGVSTTGLVPDPADATLSEREREVARLVLAGLTQKQIGARLYISSKTVEHHVARIRQRLGSTSRGELFAQLREIIGDP